MSEREFAVFVKNETVAQSIVKDLVMTILIGFCVYVSQDSTFWTFITGSMFLFIVCARLHNVVDKNQKTFKIKQGLNEWANSLDD